VVAGHSVILVTPARHSQPITQIFHLPGCYSAASLLPEGQNERASLSSPLVSPPCFPMPPEASWEAVPGAPEAAAATALTVDKRGYVYWAALGCIYECVDGVTDRRPRECHDEADEGSGPVLVFKRDCGNVSAMCTTPGGWVCACEPARREVWLYSRAMLPDQKVAAGIAAESCVCSRKGWLYLAEPATGALWLVDMGPGMDSPPVPRQVVLPVAGQVPPRSLGMSVDQQTLMVGAGAATIWSFPLSRTGTLLPPAAGSPRYRPEEPRAPAAELRVDAMCVAGGDSAGTLLAATSVGLQGWSEAGETLGVEVVPSAGTDLSEISQLDGDEPAVSKQHRWAVEAPHRVTSVTIGPGAAAPWPHIEAGVTYDMRDCYVYATVASSSSATVDNYLWRRYASQLQLRTHATATLHYAASELVVSLSVAGVWLHVHMHAVQAL
jgi:hypothetical protein